MTHSVEPRDRIFVNGYEFLPFAKSMTANSGKNISKNLSGIYSQKLLDANLLQIHLKLLQKKHFKKQQKQQR